MKPEVVSVTRNGDAVHFESKWLADKITIVWRLRNGKNVVWQNRLISISEMPTMLRGWDIV